MLEETNYKPRNKVAVAWLLLVLLIGLLVGGASGFWLRPAQLAGAAPWELSLSYQERYIEMLANDYLFSGDAARLHEAVIGWGDAELTQLLADMEIRAPNEAIAERLAHMRQALEIPAAQPTMWQMLRRNRLLLITSGVAGFLLLMAGSFGLFVAGERGRIGRAVEEAILAQAQINATAAVASQNVPAEAARTAQLGAVERAQTLQPVAPQVQVSGERLEDGSSFPGAGAGEQQSPPVQQAPARAGQPATEAVTQPPQLSEAQGQQPQAAVQAADTAAPVTPQSAEPAAQAPPVESAAEGAGLEIEKILSEVFDDDKDELQYQALLKGLAPVNIDALLVHAQQVADQLHNGKRREPGLNTVVRAPQSERWEVTLA